MRLLLVETILGFQFWTLFQALAPMIWFYPLNDLEISGYEVFVVVMFSPILLGMPIIGNVFEQEFSIMCLRLCSFLGLLSFQASTTLHRLYMLSFGCFASMIVFTAKLFEKSPKVRQLTITGLLLGFILSVITRIWFTSFNPTWWSTSSNIIVATICFITTIDKISTERKLKSQVKEVVNEVKVRDPWLRMGVGLGSLIYILQTFFAEVSVLARWTVNGYPDTGPKPYPWGLFVLVFLVIGAGMSTFRQIYSSIAWWIVGCLCLVGVYILHTWMAFSAGVLLAGFAASIFPIVFWQASKCSPSKLMFVAVLTWLCETLFSVWTVAYNFVPGGTITRERTDFLIGVIVVTLLLALSSMRRDLKFAKGGDAYELSPKSHHVLLVVLLIGAGGFVMRYSKQGFVHKLQPPKVFTAAIWTFHFGYDNDGWPSLSRAASLLRETKADVITLLESDASKPFLGNNDLAMWLAEELSMNVDFGPSTRDHTWGNLLLSKYPIVKSKHHLLPSPLGELAPAITATIDMDGDLVDFVVTHMGNDRDKLDRELQAKVLARELKNAINPVVFLGYVTSSPFSRDYEELIKKGEVNDIDPTDNDRWCEYIMYRGLIRLGYARISHGGLSDTEIQVGRFEIPNDPSNYSDHKTIELDSAKIDEQIRFSSKFGKHARNHNWERSHKYHMNTPKYFV